MSVRQPKPNMYDKHPVLVTVKVFQKHYHNNKIQKKLKQNETW